MAKQVRNISIKIHPILYLLTTLGMLLGLYMKKPQCFVISILYYGMEN